MDGWHWQTGQCAWESAGHVFAWVVEVVAEAAVNCSLLLVTAALVGGLMEARLPREELQEAAACAEV